MSAPITAIFKELVKGFGEENVFEACQTFMKQNKQAKKPRAKSAHQIFIKEVFEEMKKTNPKVKYMEAVKEASRRKKQNELIQKAIAKVSAFPPLPKSRATTEGWRTETNSVCPSDDEDTEETNIRIHEVD